MTVRFVGNEMHVTNTSEERKLIHISGNSPIGDPRGEWLTDVVVQNRMEYIKEHGRAPVTKFFVIKEKE